MKNMVKKNCSSSQTGGGQCFRNEREVERIIWCLFLTFGLRKHPCSRMFKALLHLLKKVLFMKYRWDNGGNMLWKIKLRMNLFDYKIVIFQDIMVILNGWPLALLKVGHGMEVYLQSSFPSSSTMSLFYIAWYEGVRVKGGTYHCSTHLVWRCVGKGVPLRFEDYSHTREKRKALDNLKRGNVSSLVFTYCVGNKSVDIIYSYIMRWYWGVDKIWHIWHVVGSWWLSKRSEDFKSCMGRSWMEKGLRYWYQIHEATRMENFHVFCVYLLLRTPIANLYMMFLIWIIVQNLYEIRGGWAKSTQLNRGDIISKLTWLDKDSVDLVKMDWLELVKTL